ncbi:hypothetical protein M5689_010823 [Euphorbia peplus]|nr:hypothetical protein M5689_010823 [Euphorbia peplus]
MKFLPSPNSSFDPNTLCMSQRATPSFLAGILRRILCSRSLPSDHITLTDTTDTSSHPTVASASTSPGVVGRLMGLDSSPTRRNGHKHLRVSSKLSLLEMPAFFELENEDFFVLTFDTRERSSKGKNHRRRRRKRRAKSNENINEKVQLRCKEDQEIKKNNEEHDGDSMKLTRTKKNLRIVEQEDCSSQDLSPVSVLDFDQFLFDPSDDCTIRRKLSSRLQDYSPLSTQTDDNSSGDDQNSEVNEEASEGLRTNYSPTQQNFSRDSEISRLVEDQVMQCNWKFNDVEDICADFGLGILDQMLEELADHLCSRS